MTQAPNTSFARFLEHGMVNKAQDWHDEEDASDYDADDWVAVVAARRERAKPLRSYFMLGHCSLPPDVGEALDEYGNRTSSPFVAIQAPIPSPANTQR